MAGSYGHLNLQGRALIESQLTLGMRPVAAACSHKNPSQFPCSALAAARSPAAA